MHWPEIREAYPEQWLVVEALEAHSTPDSRRHLDKIAVVEKFPDGSAAMKGCRQLYRKYPTREFYFVHTSRDELEIRERSWLGPSLYDRNASASG
jgi:hypothetical protein